MSEQRIGNLFGKYQKLPKPRRITERGELLEHFLNRINVARKKDGWRPVTMGYLVFKLTGIPTKDLYALLSKANDAERRGKPWSMAFFAEIKGPKQ